MLRLREIQLFSHWIDIHCCRIVLHCDRINLHCCRMELRCWWIMLQNPYDTWDCRINTTSAKISFLRHMSSVESSSAPDLSNSSVTESTFSTIDLTYIIIYSTTTTIRLTSTLVGWTSAATNRASYDDTARLSYKVSRARIKQTLTSKLALLCQARWGNHTRRTRGSKRTKYTLNILDFFRWTVKDTTWVVEIDCKRYNMGRRALRGNTWFCNAQLTSVMGHKNWMSRELIR
jgi:hypothetical protein